MQSIRWFFSVTNRHKKLKEKAKVKVLFVCMGNICRSPMAEGAFRQILESAGLTEQIYVDSAGTHSYHVGAPPDARGQATAQRRGIDLRGLRARKVTEMDLAEFDYVLAMDQDNFADLLELSPNTELRRRIHLFLDFAPGLPEREVPDPYYGGPTGFERVMNLVEEAGRGLLTQIREQHRL